eukprot:SAG22_NODE_1062_length_5759_cov_11.271025_5_plen_110_part_00
MSGKKLCTRRSTLTDAAPDSVLATQFNPDTWGSYGGGGGGAGGRTAGEGAVAEGQEECDDDSDDEGVFIESVRQTHQIDHNPRSTCCILSVFHSVTATLSLVCLATAAL